jgi:Domain of unknown function (DUF5753)/Helix-turn-helix domain
MTASSHHTGPTALRILLGAHLRRMREATGISREDAGWEIRSSESKISRMELGRVGFKERDVADLLNLYGLDDAEERERLLALAKDANNPGWWHRYGDVLPSWFQSYLGLEAAAERIRTYETQFVPGLLQTVDYARAVVRIGQVTLKPEEVERRVELRMDRQRIITRPRPVRLWAVLDEAVLRRPVGGRAGTRRQLPRLAETGARPNVRLQVLPFGAGAHPGMDGAFTVFRFPKPTDPEVVHLEHTTGDLYLETAEETARYAAAFEELSAAALDPDESSALIASSARKL